MGPRPKATKSLQDNLKKANAVKAITRSLDESNTVVDSMTSSALSTAQYKAQLEKDVLDQQSKKKKESTSSNQIIIKKPTLSSYSVDEELIQRQYQLYKQQGSAPYTYEVISYSSLSSFYEN
jgi:hypothetical protein